MRVVSYGKEFVNNVTVDTKLTLGQIGICKSDGTAIDTNAESFVVMSTVPAKSGGVAIQRGIDINPYNFYYEVRKYEGDDVRDKIVISTITNPALEAEEGVVYPADAEFCGAIEIVSSQPYRQGLVENPHPQILVIPVKFKATDNADKLKMIVEKQLVLTTYNKDLFDVIVEKEKKGVKITVEAKKDNRLRCNLFGIVKDQEYAGTLTIEHTKLKGFLDGVADSEEDNRYSMINYGWNPKEEWQSAWGLSDAKIGLDKVAYVIISTAEFNQFPEIAADKNSPRKFQIVVMPADAIDNFVAKLDEIKTAAHNSKLYEIKTADHNSKNNEIELNVNTK